MEKRINAKGLISHIDLSRPAAWEKLLPIRVSSHQKAPWSRSADLRYVDGGLTAYDIGQVRSLRSEITLNTNDSYLKLAAIQRMNALGEEQDTYPLRQVYDEQAGQVLSLQGGYLIGNFKHHHTPYQVLPTRYPFGVTFNTWLRPREHYQSGKNPNDGIFLFLGARAENKFAALQQNNQGLTTSQGNPLGPDHPEDLEKGVIDNVIAFRMDEEGRLGYRMLTAQGMYEDYSREGITKDDSWYYISVTYRPYQVMRPEELHCYPRRQGELSIYVNDRLLVRFRDVPEFYFTPLYTEADKQLTVPYSISWGGGTPGLKHSFHFKQNWVKSVLDPNIFTDAAQGSFDSGCDLSAFDFVPLTFIDESVRYEGQASLRLEHWDILPISEDMKTLFTHRKGVDLSADQTYEISLYVRPQGILVPDTEGSLVLELPEAEIDVLEEETVDLPTSGQGIWRRMSMKFTSRKAQRVNLRLIVRAEVADLQPGFSLHIDQLRWSEIGLKRIMMEEYSHHGPGKLLIEQYFDGCFRGDIQQLSIYDRPLSLHEIRNNYQVDASRYGHYIAC